MKQSKQLPPTDIKAPDGSPYTVSSFLKAAKISRSFFYGIPEDQKPVQVKIKAKRFILEPPLDWLRRIAVMAQGDGQ